MDNLKLTNKDIEILRELSIEYLKNATSKIHFLLDPKNRTFNRSLLESYRTELKFIKGSPEEGSFSSTSVETYTISHDTIRNLFSIMENEEIWTKLYKKLEELQLYNEFHKWNPLFSIFGFIILRYYQQTSETDDKEGFDLSQLEFDVKIFNNIFNGIMSYLVKNEVEIDFIYIIGGVKFEGNDFNYDISYNKHFIIPNNQKREELSKLLRNKYSEYWGYGATWTQFNWLSDCTAWIQGKVKIITPEFVKSVKLENRYLKDVDLFPPSYLKEALNLLGYNNAIVEFFSTSVEDIKDNYQFSISPEGVFPNYSAGNSPQYPQWMNEHFYFKSPRTEDDIFHLNDFNIQFLRMYPSFRSKIASNTFESMIINRFNRLMDYYDNNDIILESMIIFESIVTQDNKELGYQLKIKMAWLLANNLKQRRVISDIIKGLYVVRSDIVHNGGLEAEKKAKKQKLGGLQQASQISKLLARLVILRLLKLKANNLELISRTEVTKKLEDLMFGENVVITNSEYYDALSPKILQKIIGIWNS